jgi:formylmethanofuran dehydrogenase subunit C
VSERVTLTLRSPLEESIDLESIVPDRFAASSEIEIARLPVWVGRSQRAIGDYFDVRGDRSAVVRMAGDVTRAHGIGVGMKAGTIEVRGSVGNDTGVGMAGGAIHVRGDAGHRIGAGLPGASRGMTGGEIVVDGSVGDDAGTRMRRGLLFVGGDTGNAPARDIIAGTVLVMGRVGGEPALGSKRGTLVAGGEIDVPVTYRHACQYRPPHVRLALTYLMRRFGTSVDARFVTGTYDRYCGDAGTVSRGEILRWSHE